MKSDYKTPLLLNNDLKTEDYGSAPIKVHSQKYSSSSSSDSSPGYKAYNMMEAERCTTYIDPVPMSNKARNQLIIAAVICLLFTAAEALGGYFSNSLAIFTDASHMLIDFIGYAISLTAIWIAKRPASHRMTFGWYRAEVIGALLSVFTIWVITGVLIYLAILRIINQDYELDANPMLITASLGVVINIVMGIVLLPEDLFKKSDDTSEKAKVNINVRAAFIHVLGDLVQSLGVLVGSLIIKFKPEWKLADPICTFVFALLVLITTINILKDALSVLMEGAPDDIPREAMVEDLNKISGVSGVHSLHAWSLTMDNNILSVHLNIEDDQCGNYSDILQQAKRTITSHADFQKLTIQLEPPHTTASSCPRSGSDSESDKGKKLVKKSSSSSQ